jgi:hypothetical protein
VAAEEAAFVAALMSFVAGDRSGGGGLLGGGGGRGRGGGGGRRGEEGNVVDVDMDKQFFRNCMIKDERRRCYVLEEGGTLRLTKFLPRRRCDERLKGLGRAAHPADPWINAVPQKSLGVVIAIHRIGLDSPPLER